VSYMNNQIFIKEQILRREL